MRIHFTRQSVCMGDDCFDNSRDYEFEDGANWKDIMPVILENHFLASIHGNDVVWVMKNAKGKEILAYYTKKNKVIHCTDQKTLAEICGDTPELHFLYYSSRKARGDYIKKVNDNNMYMIWHDGWQEEYELCK